VYSAAWAFYGLIVVASAAGTIDYLVREVSRDRTRTSTYTVHLSVMAFVAATVLLVAGEVTVRFLGFSPGLEAGVSIMLLAIVPKVLNGIQEAVFVAHGRVVYQAITRFGSSIVYVGVSAWLLASDYGVSALLWRSWYRVRGRDRLLLHHQPQDQPAEAAVQLVARPAHHPRHQGLRGLIDRRRAVHSPRDRHPLAHRHRGPSRYLQRGDAPRGAPPHAHGAFMVNVFPQLAESFRSAEDRFLKWQSAAVRVILAFTLVFAAGCLAAADEIVRIIYGDGFAEAATVLRIIAINIAFFGLISVFWRSLVARGRQGTNLKLQSFTVVVRIASGVALIAPFAAVGAAISATASSALHLGLLVRATARSGAPPALLRQSWRFVVAAGTAGGVMWALGQWIPAVVGALVGALLYLPLLLLFRAVSAEDRLLLSRLRRRDPGAARAKEAAAD
jgi:O-antigen/teichoic acid export membrane protein